MANNSVGAYLLAVTLVACSDARGPSADAVLAEIEAAGPKVVFDQLWADGKQFDAACRAIGIPEPSGLEVARRLKSASDGGASLSLNYCVAMALPNAPVQVLGLIGREFSVDDICTLPFIEPAPGIAEQYEDRTGLGQRVKGRTAESPSLNRHS